MSELNEVVPASAVTGRPVLSLESGNKLGRAVDILIDPVNGSLLGLTVEHEGVTLELPYDAIYSVGKDAVMTVSDASVTERSSGTALRTCRARDLLGTQVVMESGEILGEIADVLVTLKPPTSALYEIRRSMLDRLLGRTFFIPASIGNVLSADARRLLVPDITAQIATEEIPDLTGPTVDVRSFRSKRSSGGAYKDPSEVDLSGLDEDATVLRSESRDDDTLLVPDEDQTVLRPRPR